MINFSNYQDNLQFSYNIDIDNTLELDNQSSINKNQIIPSLNNKFNPSILNKYIEEKNKINEKDVETSKLIGRHNRKQSLKQEILIKRRYPIKFISKKYYKETQSLKIISRRVKQVMGILNSENYKYITDYILRMYSLSEKDIKNLKRRIYDALNVIKSTSTKNIIEDYYKENEKLKIIFNNQQIKLLKKFQLVDHIRHNLFSLKALLLKNEKQQKMEEYLKYRTSHEERLFFPLVILQHMNTTDCNLELVMSDDKKRFFVSSNKEMSLFGEIELLKRVYNEN